jgi:chaperonin GroES
MGLFNEYDVEPVGDFVIVRKSERRDVSDGGLFIPDTAKKDELFAKVLAVGPGRIGSNGDRVPLQVKVGDTIVLDTIAGIPMEVEGEQIQVVREAEIVCIVRKKG